MKKIIVAFMVVLMLVIVLQNTEVVNFQFLIWTFSMSRIILLPLIFVLGFIGGFVMGKSYKLVKQ